MTKLVQGLDPLPADLTACGSRGVRDAVAIHCHGATAPRRVGMVLLVKAVSGKPGRSNL